MHLLIGLLNYLQLTNVHVFEEFPAGCKPFPSLLSPVPTTLQHSCSALLPRTRPGYCSFSLPRWLAGGEGAPEIPGEIPCSQFTPQSLCGEAIEGEILFYSYIPGDAVASQLTVWGGHLTSAGRTEEPRQDRP